MPDKFIQSIEAEAMSDSAFRKKLLQLAEQSEPTPLNAPDTGDAMDDGSSLPKPDTRPVSGRGEGRAAFQTPKGPDSVFSSDYQPSKIEEEGSKALAGGLLKTLDSVTSFPERMIDMASGEMEAEGEDYEPDWSFSKQFNIEPIIYDSEWAPYLESLVLTSFV